MRNSISLSQVQKCQKGAGGSLPSQLINVEPLEKATMNTLFTDLAPRKTTVCLHQPGQKEGLGPASQAACHEARRLGHRTWDNLQAMSLTDWLLAWLFAKTHTATTDTYSFWSGVEKCMQSVTRVSQGQLALGAAGPRHLADARSHLQPQTGMERTTSCWFKVLPWGPTAFQKFRDLPIFIYSNS